MKAVKIAQEESWKDFCNKQNKEGVWEGIYRVMKKTEIRGDVRMPLCKDGKALSTKSSVELLAETYYHEDMEENDNADHKQMRKLEKTIDEVVNDGFHDPPFIMKELQSSVRSFNPKKAPARCVVWSASPPRAPLSFPAGFQFGAATAAYQIEGGWNAADKSPSIWDVFLHAAAAAGRGETGDVACDSYHLWQRDVALAKQLGLHFYRFSISWSRLIPNIETFEVSRDGRRYYDQLIDALLHEGIEPMVTLYHWDLPQALQDNGGWLNSTISDYFAKYALTAYILFGDRVKTWFTLNEPLFFCNGGYQIGVLAPGVRELRGEYVCARNAMLAHAKAWRLYDTNFKIKYGGRVTIANHAVWFEPLKEEYAASAHLAQQHTLGLYAHPIFSKEGGWPPEVEKALALNNNTSLLPAFSEEEKQMIKGTYDLFALNFYTSRLVRPAQSGETVWNSAFYGSRFLGLVYEMDPSWNRSNLDWFAMNPPGLRKQLNWIKDQYGNPEILISENGFPSEKGLDDKERIDAVQTHLVQTLLALHNDSVRLTGYTYWSLIDNLEWHMGYGKRFGLAEVDFNATARTRTLRASGNYYRDLIRAQPRTHTRNASSSFKLDYIYLLLLSLSLAIS